MSLSTQAEENTTTKRGSYNNHITEPPPPFCSKNQPPRKRCRGISTVLQDVTNQLLDSKRICSEKAKMKIAEQTAPTLLSRGDPKAAAATRWEAHTVECEPNNNCTTLQQLFKHQPTIYALGKECIDTYIERNITSEMHKVIALKVFSTALSQNIMDAAQYASDVTGYSAFTIRKWASEYYLSFMNVCPDTVDNMMIEELLSSDLGKTSSPNPSSLLYDESFQLNTREYVRCNAYKQGEPNMTAEMFQKWVFTAYKYTICLETARLWLHHLGFSQKVHKKGMYFDGHEREEHRSQLVAQLNDLDRKCIYPGHQPQLHEGERPIIQIHHDESTFYAIADQHHYWSDGKDTVLSKNPLVRLSWFLTSLKKQVLTIFVIMAQKQECYLKPKRRDILTATSC